jgi:hypothetical protein
MTQQPSIEVVATKAPIAGVPQPQVAVEATSFYVEYIYDGRTATTTEYEEASMLTLSYLDNFMQVAFERNGQIDYSGQDVEVLAITTGPDTISYAYQALFGNETGKTPGTADMDRLLVIALTDANQVLLAQLSEIGHENPFATTTQLVYSTDLDFSERFGGGTGDGLGVPGSAIALLVIGILLGITGLGMILLRRRRFQQIKPTVAPQAPEKPFTTPPQSTHEDSEPGLSQGSSLIDVRWSMDMSQIKSTHGDTVPHEGPIRGGTGTTEASLPYEAPTAGGDLEHFPAATTVEGDDASIF